MKKILSTLPILLFPYLTSFLLIVIQNDTLMNKLFNNNIYITLIYIVVFWIIALINTVIFIIINISNKSKDDIITIPKTIMVIKIIQIPAYLVIFITGLICIITIFTIHITLLLILFDCLSIILTGMLGILSVIKLYKSKIISFSEMILYGILQFIFCIDIFISIILYIKTIKNTFSEKSLHL